MESENSMAEKWISRIKEYKDEKQSRAEASKRRAALHNALIDLINHGPGPKAADLALTVYDLYGDPLDATRASYLRSCLNEIEKAEGNVLLSSVSLMTLILGAVSAGDKKRTIWCLEQDPHWINMMRSMLTQYAIKRTYIVAAPPVVKGGMVHYRLDTAHLPKNISLVMCERSNAAPGAALSTLLSAGPHLAEEFTIFARKTCLDEDGPLLKRWASRHNATFAVINARDGFVKMTRRERQSQTGRAHYEIVEVPEEEVPGTIRAPAQTSSTSATA